MDSGIAELMQGIASDVPMQGPMDEGVGALMAAGAGNTPPVNFRHGGSVAVRGFSNGTPAAGNLAQRAKALYPGMQELYSGVLGSSEDRSADLEEQKKMTQAQMLFDIAGTALNFAGNTQGNTVAERLANAATQSQLTDKIGSRSADLLKLKTAQKAEQRQLDMAALQGAVGEGTRQLSSEADLAEILSKPKPVKMMNVISADGKLITSIDVANNGEEFRKILKDNVGSQPYIPGSKQVANIKYVYTFDGNTYSTEPFDVNANLNGYNKALKGKNAFNEKGAEPKLSAIKKIAELDVTGRTQTWHRAKEDFTLGKGEDVRKVKKGEVIALTLLQANNLEGKVAEYDSDVSITEVYKFGEDSKLLVSGPEFVNQVKALGKGWSTTKAQFEQTVFSTVVNGKPVTETVNLSTPEGQRRAIELDAMNYISDNPEVDAIIKAEVAERFDIRRAGREAKAPFYQEIDGIVYLIDPSKPEEEPKVILDAKELGPVFGTSKTGLVMSISNDEALLAKYGAGTLSKEVDGITYTDMEAALKAYTSPLSENYNESTKDYTVTPGMTLSTAQIEALRSRKIKGLPLPTGVKFTVDAIEDEVNKILSEQDKSTVGNAPLAEFLTQDAWGSAGWAKKWTNTITEALTFPAIFKDAKTAEAAILNLNQEFETMFMAAQEIRDSVFQGKKLEVLTPDPSKFWTGPEASRTKALSLYRRLKSEIRRTENSILDPSVPLSATGSGSVSIKKQRLAVLKDLADGYRLLAQVDLHARGIDASDIDRIDVERNLMNELDAALGIIVKD